MFKAEHYLTDEDLAAMQSIDVPAEREVQDYRSTYNDIRDWLRRERSAKDQSESSLDWDEVVFEVDLLKSQEINLGYILELIFEHNKDTKDKSALVEEVFSYAQVEQQREVKDMIAAESLNEEAAKRYITASLKREYASENGTELNAILPKLSPLNPQYLTKKQSVLQKIAAFVEKFKGVGGKFWLMMLESIASIVLNTAM